MKNSPGNKPDPQQPRPRPKHPESLTRGYSDLPAVAFPSPEPPALEGEGVCLCWHAEGIHDAFGACSVMDCGCVWFVEFDDSEEHTHRELEVPAELRTPESA